MLKKSKINLKYSFFWILLGFIFIAISIHPKFIDEASNLLDIYTPITTVLLILILTLLLITFTQTVAISKLKEQVICISQEIGILDKKIEDKKTEDKKNDEI